MAHTTVLLMEAVEALMAAPALAAAQVPQVVDATYGRGGHSRALLARLGARARLVAYDKDPEAVAQAASLNDTRFEIRHASFTALADWPSASLAGVLMDLGVSSPQIDQPERGFSFRADGPLDMRMNPQAGESVAQWLARAPESEIAEVIHDYGEERFARPIAKALVARRQAARPLERTAELAQLVADTVKTREAGQHPATRTFQAFRIYINHELDELASALTASLRALAPGGRLAVIAFHSLEDRLVKQFIARHAHAAFDRRAPFAAPPPVLLHSVARLRPSAAEVQANPRARSAILRVAERSAQPLGVAA